jgi:hypothetical protein
MKARFFGNLYSGEQQVTTSDLIIGGIWGSILTFGLSIAFRHIDLEAVVTEEFSYVLIAGVMGISYYLGRHFSCLYKKRWANYFAVYMGVTIITVLGWASYGTHTEDADPLFGGGTTVVDFDPTKRDRSNHAGRIFFGLLPAALLGVYNGQNNDERRLKEVMAAMEISKARSSEKNKNI